MILPGIIDFKTECKDQEGFIKYEREEYICIMPVI